MQLGEPHMAVIYTHCSKWEPSSDKSCSRWVSTKWTLKDMLKVPSGTLIRSCSPRVIQLVMLMLFFPVKARILHWSSPRLLGTCQAYPWKWSWRLIRIRSRLESVRDNREPIVVVVVVGFHASMVDRYHIPPSREAVGWYFILLIWLLWLWL